jgi:hypothetical protein
MLIRLVFALGVSIQRGTACDCIRLPVKVARRGAEIIFEGTVAAVRPSDRHERVATFKVARVWKGNVSEIFEMIAIQEEGSCYGFGPPISFNYSGAAEGQKNQNSRYCEVR